MPRVWFRSIFRPELAALAVALAAGCGRFEKWVDKCASIPKGAIPPPSYIHVNELADRQAAKAEVDDFAIYKYEWEGTSAKLNVTGRRHVRMIALRLRSESFPVVIETSTDAELDESRRQTVIAALAELDVPEVDELVKVDYPEAEPLKGVLAPIVGAGYVIGGQGQGGGMGGGVGGGGLGGGFGGGLGGGIGGGLGGGGFGGGGFGGSGAFGFGAGS
jgi:hypothetical protein